MRARKCSVDRTLAVWGALEDSEHFINPGKERVKAKALGSCCLQELHPFRPGCSPVPVQRNGVLFDVKRKPAPASSHKPDPGFLPRKRAAQSEMRGRAVLVRCASSRLRIVGEMVLRVRPGPQETTDASCHVSENHPEDEGRWSMGRPTRHVRCPFGLEVGMYFGLTRNDQDGNSFPFDGIPDLVRITQKAPHFFFLEGYSTKIDPNSLLTSFFRISYVY